MNQTYLFQKQIVVSPNGSKVMIVFLDVKKQALTVDGIAAKIVLELSKKTRITFSELFERISSDVPPSHHAELRQDMTAFLDKLMQLEVISAG